MRGIRHPAVSCAAGIRAASDILRLTALLEFAQHLHDLCFCGRFTRSKAGQDLRCRTLRVSVQAEEHVLGTDVVVPEFERDGQRICKCPLTLLCELWQRPLRFLAGSST